MKKILIILSVLTLLSCNKKPVSVTFLTSYKLGSPNLYVANAKLYNQDKNLGEIATISEGETQYHSYFTIPPGDYIVKWYSFNKNGLGNQLNKTENAEKITVMENEDENYFTILGDKLFDKKGYKTYHITDSTVTEEVAAEMNKIETDSIYIIKRTDDMTDKTNFYPSRRLNLSEGKGSAELHISIKKQNNKLTQDDLCVIMDIGGHCIEDNTLIIMFSNSQKISLMSFNKFNCDGTAWFHLSNEQCKLLSSQPIDKIRIKNGRTYDEMTATLKINKDYFIQTFYAMNTNKIKELKKE
jgi:hypothetical protein